LPTISSSAGDCPVGKTDELITDMSYAEKGDTKMYTEVEWRWKRQNVKFLFT
jgi:hypothetical protein